MHLVVWFATAISGKCSGISACTNLSSAHIWIVQHRLAVGGSCFFTAWKINIILHVIPWGVKVYFQYAGYNDDRWPYRLSRRPDRVGTIGSDPGRSRAVERCVVVQGRAQIAQLTCRRRWTRATTNCRSELSINHSF